jgi:subtilisin family serine protease
MKNLTILFLIGTILVATYSAGLGNHEDDIDLDKLSVTLFDAGIGLKNGYPVAEEEGTIDLLVRVKEDNGARTRNRMENIGVDLGYRFSCLNVYQARIDPEMITRLALLEEVEYIEWDAPGTFDLDVSTETVRAPPVWSSLIRKGSGLRPGVSGDGIGIAVVDSGIDAGHPDLDYGIKTVKNIKAVRAGDPWVEMENTDTSVGHGSHCAGIAAGNGDASAGSRRGVAPGANLIGLALTEGDEEISTSNYLYGLEWVYENSKPGANPYNIKVCTNSWHTTVGEYDPEMALSRIINKLTYENNVVCTFSAGNDGRLDPEGEEVWTSQQGNVPGAVMVAAHARDGSYVAEFTSHGKVGLNHTYPDVGGPGVRIWAAHARRTGISAGSKLGGNPNPYYLAISGTSMSTPHIAGTVALLWEACPSMDISRWSEDYNGTDPDWFYSHEMRFVHDSELILEAASTPLQYVEGGGSETGIFRKDDSTGWGGRSIDYTQGYGLIDVDRAVGIALTLNELRSRFPGRYVDVFSALKVYEGAMVENLSLPAGKLTASWVGEYSRFNDQNGKPLIVQNQTKYIYVPDGTESIRLDIEFDILSLSERYLGGLTVDIDTDLDGEPDIAGGIPIISQPGSYDIGVSGTGTYYGITVRGQGIKLIRPLQDDSYVEMRIPYSISVVLELDASGVKVGKGVFKSPMNAYYIPERSTGGENSTMGVRIYDLNSVADPFGETPTRQDEDGSSTALMITLILLVTLLVLVYGYYRWKKGRGN